MIEELIDLIFGPYIIYIIIFIAILALGVIGFMNQNYLFVVLSVILMIGYIVFLYKSFTKSK